MAMRTLLPLLLLGALVVCSSGPARAAVSTASLLEELRKATLSRPLSSIASLHSSGRIEALGISGTVQEWGDVRAARFQQSQIAGALTGSFGWDGKVSWNEDYAGLTTVDGGMAGRLQALDQAYLDTLQYARPDAGGATVIYAGQRAASGTTYDVLAVTPPQGSEIDLWIDPRSHLIAEETSAIGNVSTTTTLSNYHRVDGINYPFASHSQSSNGNSSEIHLSSLEINVDISSRTRVPATSVHDFSVAGGSATVPLQVVNNHLYVSAMLDGRGPYTFILDSGGDYIVTPDVAAALGARSSGTVQLQGVGNASEGAAFTRIDSIAVGSAVVRNQYMLVLPIDTGFGVAEGMHIDGMIGYQFLARFITTIDYGAYKLMLAVPAASPASMAGAAPLNFYFDGTVPRIQTTIDGVTADAEVDTGSRAGLTISSPFLAAHPDIAVMAKTGPGVAGFGVGGASYARLGRIPRLQIGPYLIANSIADFTVQAKGAFADPFNPANIGGAIWRRFTVAFDYAHHQMLLAKNASFDFPPASDRSGAFLIAAREGCTVIGVFPASPAASSGLAKGDVLLAVNGTPAANQSLAAVRAVLSAASGTVVHLHIRGPRGVERDVTLTLADYV